MGFLLGAAVLIVVFVMIESHRQTKKYGKGSGRGGRAVGAGMMELQNLFQPERKVEIVARQNRKEEAHEEESDEVGEDDSAHSVPS